MEAAGAFVALAPRLEGDLVRKASRALMRRVDGYQRVAGLAALLPRLEGMSRREALAAATKATLAMDMDGLGYPARAAVALGPYLEGRDRQRILSKGLESALAIGDYEMGAQALITLAPHLDPELRSGALRECARAYAARV